MALYRIDTGGRLEPHIGQEWLLTNGMGAYASSTVAGCNARKYHGLLVATTLPPVGRIMALNRVGETLTLDGGEPSQVHLFSVNHFAGNVFPRGDRYLRAFELPGDGTARWEYDIDGVRVVKEVLLAWQRNRVGVRYTVEAGARKAKLSLQPFVSLRDFHATRRGTSAVFAVSQAGQGVTVRQGEHAVHLACDGGAAFALAGDWWLGHVYPIETDRGQDDTEDLFTPGSFVAEVAGGRVAVTLWASMATPGQTGGERSAEPSWEQVKASRPDPMAAYAGEASETVRRLVHSADDFIVSRKAPDGSAGTTVLAGYPWFADWGRDTMIALPGLLLATGRHAEAKRVLTLFAGYVSGGMIPNRFDDYNNEPSYNTVDASLWFVHACFEYRKATGDEETFERVLRPACAKVIEGYRDGTRYHIRMDPADGLITSGDATTQLTWMDAKHQGVVFTPRHGKAVEINALWYQALCLMGEREMAETTREGFVRAFWISRFRGLADVVSGDGRRDMQIRPNQILAASLEHSPLSREQRLAVCETVRRELLTPVGLRTLAVTERGYEARYHGPQSQRDRAYHNGTIWAWLMGPFLSAWLRSHDESPEAEAQCRQWLEPLLKHMEQDGCIGSISEIFEAAEPYRAVGCCAQAWSVAEVLRLAVRLGL